MVAESVLELLLSKPVVVFFSIAALFFVIARALEPHVDKREPPAIRPRIPFIGHFIRAVREQSVFLDNLAKEFQLPIATLPVLKGKIYAIWDPILIQSAYCNKNLSFTPYALDNVRAVTGYDDFSHHIVSSTDVLPVYFRSMYDGTTARHVHQLNVTSLEHVSQYINNIGPNGLDVPNIYMWLRNLMTVATCEGLFGPRNPIRDEQSVEDVWTFETGLKELFLSFYNTATLRETKNARKRLQDTLAKYCDTVKDDDEEVSAYIRYRLAVLRKYGIEGQRVGDIEVALVHVPTSNSIPTCFWVFIYIFTNRDLVAQLRTEVEPVTERVGNQVIVNVDDLSNKCPLLISTFREVSRIANKFTCNRRVVEDTTITDGQGRAYLLKKGAAIQMPSGPMHGMANVWGPDADQFRPDRFMDRGLPSKNAKLRRSAWTPFGGGAHLCPGRNFATAEILGFVTSMLLGYRVEPVDGNWENFRPPPMGECPLATAVCKPADEGSVFGTRVTRRRGWESVEWKFTSGKVWNEPGTND